MGLTHTPRKSLSPNFKLVVDAEFGLDATESSVNDGNVYVLRSDHPAHPERM